MTLKATETALHPGALYMFPGIHSLLTASLKVKEDSETAVD